MPLIKRRRFLKPKEAAEMRGCSVTSLKRYIIDPADDFPKPIIDRGHMKWDEREVEEWLERKLAERDKTQARICEIFRNAG